MKSKIGISIPQIIPQNCTYQKSHYCYHCFSNKIKIFFFTSYETSLYFYKANNGKKAKSRKSTRVGGRISGAEATGCSCILMNVTQPSISRATAKQACESTIGKRAAPKQMFPRDLSND